MVLALSFALIALGIAALAFDRRLVAVYRVRGWHYARLFQRTTDWAKGGPWLILSVVLYAIVAVLQDRVPALRPFALYAAALALSVVISSAVLHLCKLLLGRRRPRDHVQHGLYGINPFAFDTRYDSFPSGHAVTIFCVATVASAAWPMLAIVFFLIAAYLGATRAFLTSHFTSDALIGAGLGTLIARETLVLAFPSLSPAWF